jgi:hypothetical protein
MEHERDVFKEDVWHFVSSQQPEYLAHERRVLSRDPSRMACLRQILARETRGDQVDFREIPEFPDVIFETGIGKTVPEYGDRRAGDFAEHLGRVTCFAEAELESTDPGE